MFDWLVFFSQVDEIGINFNDYPLKYLISNYFAVLCVFFAVLCGKKKLNRRGSLSFHAESRKGNTQSKCLKAH